MNLLSKLADHRNSGDDRRVFPSGLIDTGRTDHLSRIPRSVQRRFSRVWVNSFCLPARLFEQCRMRYTFMAITFSGNYMRRSRGGRIEMCHIAACDYE